MLQSIHEKIKGWFLIVFVALLSIGFVFWGVEYYFEASSDQSTVAKVDGQKISQNQLSSVVRNLSQSQQQQPITEQSNQQLKQTALQQLITNAALYLAALKQGFQISIDQIKQFIESVPQLQDNGQFSPQKFQQLLYSNSMQPQQFFSEMRANLLIQQVSAGIQSTSFVLPQEISQAYNMIKQTRDFGYLIISSQNLASKMAVSEEAIQQYYQAHQDQFKTEPQAIVSYLLLTPESLQKTIQVSDQDVKNYYQANQNNYVIPQQWDVEMINVALPAQSTPSQIADAQNKLNDVSQSLQKGKSFEQVAAQPPQGMNTNKLTLNEDQISADLKTVLSQMQPQGVSAPVQTPVGMSLIKLIEMKPRRTRSLAETQLAIQKMLQQQKADRLMADKSDQLSNLTFTNPTTLDVAAKTLGLSPLQSSPLTRAGEKSGIFSNSIVMAAIFNPDVLTQGNNSSLINLPDGSALVLRVTKHIPSQVNPLNLVHDQIKNILAQQQIQNQTQTIAIEIQKALAANQDPETIAKKYSLVWTTKKAIGRDDKTLPAELISAVFNLPAQNKTSQVVQFPLSKGDYGVVKLLGVNTVSPQAKAGELTTLQGNMQGVLGQLEYQSYVKSALGRVKVKIYKQALNF